MSPVAMDPQVRAFLAAANASPQPAIETLPIATVRKQYASLTPIFHPYVDLARVTDLRTDAGVSLRIYQPASRSRGPQPGIVYFHGGGWVMGDLETHDTLCRQLAYHAAAVVIAVDYRRAPEHPFPAAFDDAFAAVRQVCDRASSMGLDATRIAVAGDSAGGNLAAAVALKARDAGGPTIAMQCLLYPVLDHGCDSESYRSFATEHGLTAAKMHFFWRSYLGGADGGQPYASPLRAKDLTGLPPAHIITAEYDVLRDEGEAYARRLRSAGVRVELERCAGMIHGFLHYAGAIHHGQRVSKDLGRRLATELGGGQD
jgi:acetyl esterase